MTSHFPRPTSNSIDDAFDLSHIFIGRDHQLDQFEIYLNRWGKIMFDADLDVPVARNAPSPDEKIQGLVVLLYGRGGFGKSTLLRRYRDIVLRVHDMLPSSKVIASAVVDWENATEGRRSLFNISSPKEIDALVYFKMLCAQLAMGLGKNIDDFKHYQRAIKAVENARNQAIRVIETIRDDQDSRSLSRLTSEGVVALLRLVPYVGVPLKDEQLAEVIKRFVGEGIDITVGKVAQLYAKLHDKLGTRFGDYLEPDLKLGLNLGYDLLEFAKDFPLLIFFDTYEEIDEGDRLLRIVMGAAGLRVGWILAGRDNLWAGLDQRLRSRGIEYGYKELVPSDRGLAIDFNMGGVGAFTPSDLKEYFDAVCRKVKYDPPLPQITTSDAKRIWDVTWGIPLAVRIAAGIYLETANLTDITRSVKGKHEIVDQMVRRYLLHVRDDESDRVKLYGLVMLRRTDQPTAVATALGLLAEQARTGGYAIALNRLHRRYSFIFTDKDEPMLHQEVRHFLRLWLLERRTQPEIIAINKELKNAHELALQQLEDQRKYNTLKERMQDDDWVRTYLDLIDQRFWLDPVEGLFYILPFMFAAAIYNRDVNEDAAALGMFFKAALGAPYRNWLMWTNQSLVYLHSSYPSANELYGLEKLEQLTSQGNITFRHPLPEYRKELEASLCWRLAEAWSFRDENKALGYYEKALTQLSQETELRTAAAMTYREVARILYTQEKYSECLPLLDKAIELKSDYAAAYEARGIIYDNLEESERALADFDRSLELDPNEATAYFNRGLTYSYLKESERALADFDRSLELDPSHASTYYHRGDVYFNLKEYKRAIEDYDRALKLDANNASVYNDRGLAYYEQKEYERSIEDYNRALELDPKSALAFYNRGLAYDHLKEYERAIEDYNRALELDPNDAKPYNNRGLIYNIQGEYKRAIADFDKVLELEPNNALIYTSRAIAYDNLNQYERAIEDYNRALELDPEFALAYFYRGIAYSFLEEYEHAIEDYDRALELDPNDAKAYYNRGLAFAYLEEYEYALADFDRSLELDPNDAKAYYNRGLAYTLLKDASHAKTDFNRCFELDKTFLNAPWMAIWIGLSKERVGSETAENLESIATLNPSNYIACVCRGVALGLYGKVKEGLREVEKAIPLSTQDWDAYFWKGMLHTYYHQEKSRDKETMTAIERSLNLGLPPILLTPLFWLEKDRPDFFKKHIRPLLEHCGLIISFD